MKNRLGLGLGTRLGFIDDDDEGDHDYGADDGVDDDCCTWR